MAGRSRSADESRIDSGLAAMCDLPREERSLSALRVFLGQRDPEGIGARLERWCKGGSLGWVLDADEDSIGLDALALGFDMTDVLDHAAVRTPLMMYLFHRVEELIDGRRIVIAIDEFWKALGDEAFRALANDGLKTIRKKNGVMVFGTQSPRDALASPIAHTIVEQCPTQVFFPNPRGQPRTTSKAFTSRAPNSGSSVRIWPRRAGASWSSRVITRSWPSSIWAAWETRSPSCPAGPRTSSSSTASGAKSAMTRPPGCLGSSNSERNSREKDHKPTSNLGCVCWRRTSLGPAAAQVAVFDPSVFARQFEQLTEMKKQVETLTSQLKVAQDQLGQAKQLYDSFNKLTNVNDIASLLNSSEFRKYLPRNSRRSRA